MAKIKLIKSLKYKKFRQKNELFIIEGEKTFLDFLSCKTKNPGIPYEINTLFATSEWLQDNSNILPENIVTRTITISELKKISFLKTPNQILVLIAIKKTDLIKSEIENSLSLVLDQIQDPGNLGTIIRTADWYGIKHVICSANCADIYNPKTVQATMGSLFRVNVYYTDLVRFLAEYSISKDLIIYGAFMDGENIYNIPLPNRGIIVLGNESKGISSILFPYIKRRISIPTYNKTGYPDSLNVAAAAAIICSEFRRRK